MSKIPDIWGQYEGIPGKEKISFRERIGQLRGVIVRVLIAAGAFAAIFAILWFTAMPEQLGLVAGEISDATVYAPRDVVDTITTQANRDAAYRNVMEKDRRYSVDQTVVGRVTENVRLCFDSMEKAWEMGDAERQRLENARKSSAAETPAATEPPADPSDPILGEIFPEEPSETEEPIPEETPVPAEPVTFSAEFLDAVGEILYGTFEDAHILTVLDMPRDTLSSMRQTVSEQIALEMHNNVQADNLAGRQSIISQRMGDSYTLEQKLLVDAVAVQFMEANAFYDEEATVALAEAAAAEVPNVVIRKGQRIVAQGEPVSEVQLQLIADLGLLDDGDDDLRIPAGMVLMLLVLFGMSALYLHVFNQDYLRDTGKLLLLCLSMVLTLGVCALTQQVSLHLSPAMLVAMWLASMTNRRMAVFMNVIMAFMVGILASDASSVISASAFPIILNNVLAGTTAIIMLGYGSNRMTVINAGLISGMVAAVSMGAIDMMAVASWNEILLSAFAGFCSGMLAALVCLSTLPIWEYVFQLVTPMKLLELSNPNQPLLKKLLLEAPGTYHHSIVVGNLAETAAEAVGGNPMLARTGACYHDIGKLRRPYFFKENQVGSENPHDSISTELSVRIITSHVTDGLELARKYRLPPQIMDIIEQHHGNTLVTYFYYKARNAAEDPDSIREEEYRYPGHRPTSKEAAIIMMADSVEAAVRTLVKPTPQSIEELVRKIVKGKFDDGQMDECNLTMGDFETLIHVFVNVLSAIYHERIVYPSDVPKPKIIQEDRS